MADITILVCACGMRLKAAGAVPGRVGKCPACGGLLRVPGAGPPPLADSPSPASPAGDADEPAGYGVGPPSATLRPSTYSAPRGRGKSTPAAAPGRRGFLRAPERPETRIRESWSYPLWADSGIALLAFIPPIFWFASIPIVTFVLSGMDPNNLAGGLAALLSLLPTGLILLTVGTYTLLYLGRVLVTSALGDMHPPRWPEWDPTEILHGLGRWLWAFLTGAIVGGLPATAYWVYCGDIDPVDSIVLVELVAVGAVYAQMALLASLLHDDALGANPITVGLAIWRCGWGSVPPSLMIGGYVTAAAFALPLVLAVKVPWLAAVGYWVYWVFLLYGAMVVLRVLGLFYHRHARQLGWFRDRPRWGA